MNKIIELFGNSKDKPELDWIDTVNTQHCPYLQKRCIKVRKSQPEIAIGTLFTLI
ncbi:MAG: hypothetical protein F6K47_25625 [Symploca sp. SIO2E6]|nr:hypothetical protein [Symploca sp. SIO2E6]